MGGEGLGTQESGGGGGGGGVFVPRDGRRNQSPADSQIGKGMRARGARREEKNGGWGWAPLTVTAALPEAQKREQTCPSFGGGRPAVGLRGAVVVALARLLPLAHHCHPPQGGEASEEVPVHQLGDLRSGHRQGPEALLDGREPGLHLGAVLHDP